jgi:antitoxin VapB
MALNIKDAETDSLARQLADLTGASITEAVKGALADKLVLERKKRGRAPFEELLAIAKRCASLPVLDDRSPEDMLYDERGLPK